MEAVAEFIRHRVWMVYQVVLEAVAVPMETCRVEELEPLGKEMLAVAALVLVQVMRDWAVVVVVVGWLEILAIIHRQFLVMVEQVSKIITMVIITTMLVEVVVVTGLPVSPLVMVGWVEVEEVVIRMVAGPPELVAGPLSTPV